MMGLKRGAQQAAGREAKRAAQARPLIELPRDDLMPATMICRPSKRNRSPFVADVRLEDETVAIAHVPSLELGGKCVAGAKLIVQRLRDRKGEPVAEDALGKYGTPKCTVSAKLCQTRGGVWVGAHPSLGERIANELLGVGQVYASLHTSPITSVKREVAAFAGTRSRLDFMVTHEDGSTSVVEVKTVVDSDKDGAGATLERDSAYATFPWGKRKQKSPDGEGVVSLRAIEHVGLLADIAAGRRTHGEHEAGSLRAGVLFVVVRHDTVAFRPNAEACPVFAEQVRRAQADGVKVMAHAVRWADSGAAFSAGELPIELC